MIPAVVSEWLRVYAMLEDAACLFGSAALVAAQEAGPVGRISRTMRLPCGVLYMYSRVHVPRRKLNAEIV